MTNTYHSDIVNNDIAKTTLSNNNETNWTWSNTAQYVTQIGKHNIDVLGGMEFSKQSVIDFSAYSEGYALEDKDKNPDTEVVVMTMGLPKAAEM